MWHTDFFTAIDKTYNSYFNDRQDHIESIGRCFLIINEVLLVYNSSTNLRSDIYKLVVDKHMLYYGEKGQLNIV
jgi:hypothetical protein